MFVTTKRGLWVGIGILGLGFFAPLTLQGREGGVGGLPSFVSYGRQLLVLGEVEPVCGGKTLMAAWSPDSQSVIALREFHAPGGGALRDHPEVSLVLWDAVTRRSREIWHKQVMLRNNDAGRFNPQWMGKTGIAFIKLDWWNAAQSPGEEHQGQGALKIDTVRGTVTEVPLQPGESVLPSPTEPSAVVTGQEYHRETAGPGGGGEGDAPDADANPKKLWFETTISLLGRGGTPGKSPFRIRDYSIEDWTQDGKKLVLIFREHQDKKIVRHWIVYDPAAGTIAKQDTEPAAYVQTPDPPSRLSLKNTTAKIQEGKTVQTVHPVWIESQGKKRLTRALLTPDGKPGALSPSGANALYFAQGAAWVVALKKVPKAEYLAAVKTTLLSNAKQAGTALMMYVQDYDEIFPPSDGEFVDRVDPYLKNRELLDGFDYHRPGEGLAGLEKPAETIMGTVDGLGGRAVVYADGHARWEPSPEAGGEDDDD